MYTYQQRSLYKPYREARVFSNNELLFMELKALVLFGATAKDWWRRLSPAEKYQILFSEDSSTVVNEIRDNSKMIQQV